MAVVIFIGAPPPSYARKTTRLLASKRAARRRMEALQYRDNRSSSLEPVPTTPPNNGSITSDDNDVLPVAGSSQQRKAKARPRPQLQNTPYGHGTASHSVIELQTVDGHDHNVTEMDAYLREDLRRRIFIEFETFLVKILHLPDDWRVSFKSVIDAVQDDPDFKGLLWGYLNLCNKVGTGYEKERRLYCPHADLCNRVIDVAQMQSGTEVSNDDNIEFFRMDPYSVRGSNDAVRPDIVGMLRTIFKLPDCQEARDRIKKFGRDKRCPSRFVPGWPHVIEVKEMKATDDTIDEGVGAIRLLTKDGKDPMTTRPKKNRKDKKDEPKPAESSGASSTQEGEASQGGSKGRKRKADTENERSSSKFARTSKTVSSRAQRAFDDDSFPSGTDRAEKARIQCARYALQILSNAGLRSHALVTLIDCDRVQLSYYDRSAIIVSQAIDLGEKDDEMLFIAMLIGCHRLTLKQRGILHHIIEDPYITNFNRFNTVSNDPKKLFSGLLTTLQRNGKTIEVNLGRTIYRQRGLIGRDSCVVAATCNEWPGMKLVVKISWPSTSRKSEKALVDKAKAEADKKAGDGKRHWVLDHLPNILHEQDFPFDDDSAQKMIAEVLHDGEFIGGEGTYEDRVLRISVMEELFPIKSLREAKDYAQVFVDILQCHKWLYDHPRILHRDISMANIMYRRDSKGNICGVLNDFDLSSLLPIKEATSLHRTGTPPYMAFDLLQERNDGPHLYRHDLEALFYVMLMICCRHSIIEKPQPGGMSQLKEISEPFSRWFARGVSWEDLAKFKTSFFTDADTLPVSPCFDNFRPWLDAIRNAFSIGINARRSWKKPLVNVSWVTVSEEFTFGVSVSPQLKPLQEPVQAPFDDMTLGGFITYQTFLIFMHVFNGKKLILKNKDIPPAVMPS
ncbi:uncharacterized protein BT62DRAFT_1076518 [Guyanagaster necrorhizus]|uniref:Protein kinase domain-containing protein n=1 Tax=Guyanagaster necrorhizus TaxID=856835 RepID=A0A9P7VU58_9AGAR|nr:uncharacterized protein BT62DRAFT_1076518 [Guyanagaster necrorhizus MCA 3950]KAG7446129.1 hypothetical protein BT62DRAFT_1076518 [Guyanagaster necrorhizus MCA 3950]